MTTGAAFVGARTDSERAAESGGGGLIDVNVNLGRWPVRRLACDEPARLVAKLRSRGITQAWAGTFEGLLHKDLGAVNARLTETCRRHGHGVLLPFGSINPAMPGWENDLRVCAEVHGMRGIRLHPNYHGYSLDHPTFAQLLHQAAQRKLIVQIALVMEDERMMHPLLRVEPVNTAPLAGLVQRSPGLRLILLNALRTLQGESLKKLLSAGDVWVEISMLEGVGGVGALLDQLPVNRLLFGSHAPLFYAAAAELKLNESLLTPAQRHALRHGSAERLLA
jgi:hypothetical protein